MKAWITGKLIRKPLFTFSLVSMVLIVVMVIANGYTQSKFFMPLNHFQFFLPNALRSTR